MRKIKGSRMTFSCNWMNEYIMLFTKIGKSWEEIGFRRESMVLHTDA